MDLQMEPDALLCLLFMDSIGKDNAQKAEQILQKHFERHGVISGNQTRSGVFDALVQSDEEIGPTSTDLLSDDINEPQIRIQWIICSLLELLRRMADTCKQT